MSHHTRTSSIVALLLVQTVAVGLATSPVVAAEGKQDGVCRRATKYLPRTPDAVEGWLRHCPAGSGS